MHLVFNTFNTYFCLFYTFFCIFRINALRYKIYKNMKKSVKTVQYLCISSAFYGLTVMNHFFVISISSLLTLYRTVSPGATTTGYSLPRCTINFIP